MRGDKRVRNKLSSLNNQPVTFEKLVAQLIHASLVDFVLQFLCLRPDYNLLVEDGILVGIAYLTKIVYVNALKQQTGTV